MNQDFESTDLAHRTLKTMEGAKNYNAWIGRKVAPHLGSRVLEVGAGLGTITEQIEAGRDRVVCLETERVYLDELRLRFAARPHVVVRATDGSGTDWGDLANERLDSALLTNVLEHIQDDGGAIGTLCRTLRPGSMLVILVPALPWLYGSLDLAVGHHRRYTPSALRAVLEGNGCRILRMEWMNLIGIPGWLINGRIFRRRAMPPLQLALYDRLAPWLARLESGFRLPIGMSLFAVAQTP